MRLSLLFILFYCSIGFPLIFDIPLKDIYYNIEKYQGYDRICLEKGVHLENPGAPEIKSLIYTYAIPSGQSIREIEILEQEWQEIPGEYFLYPEQKYYSLKKSPQFTEINPEIYNSETPYPATPLINYKSGNLRGYNLYQFQISPFRYLPKMKRLMILKKFTIKVMTTLSITGIQPKRQSTRSEELYYNLISSVVTNKPLRPPYSITENPDDSSPTDLPSLIGPPVDLVIITTDNLVPGYERFAQLKKLFGYNTVIKTISWIRQHYSGFDDAERIRNFIKDAVEKWGTGFILLGGDVPDIPTRSVWLAQVDYDQWPENITTDWYFSCLDGTWNFDGDAKFGEVADSVDLYPDVLVSRLTLKNNSDIIGYTNKNLSYHSAINPGIQTKALFLTSNLFYPNDAYELARYLATYLPRWFSPSYLNERNLQNFKDSIYAGYGIIQAIAHGDVNLLRVNSIPQYTTNFFFDSLTNYDRYPIMITISCYTNPFQSDCLGEHFVNNPAGAGIAYIGPTDVSEGYLHTSMTTYLYSNLYSHTLAEALALSKIPFIPNASNDNWYRYYLYSINLIGDPTITIWDSIPRHFNAIVVNPDTLNIGTDTITITTNPLVDSFQVIYYKENDVFIRDTGFVGSAVSVIKTKSSGYLKFTILADRYIPHFDSIYVKPASPYPVFEHFVIKDSLNNNNGILNPGEDIFLYIALKNNGGVPAENITAIITCTDSFINLITDSASYPVILPDSIGKNLTPFYFKVNNSIPDEHSLNFAISISYNNNTKIDTFQVISSSPQLKLFTQHYYLNNDSLLLFPQIENSGSHLADSVKCIISALSDTITIIDSIAYFHLILPDSVEKITDTLMLTLNYPGTIRYKFRAYYRNIEIINRDIKIQSLSQPDSLVSIGYPNSIGLKWRPVPGAIGYRIYRATNPQGPYKLLKNSLLPISYFEDYEVAQNTHYYYYLFGVDSSMNHGISSDTVQGITNPMIASGWPRTVYGHPYTSPNFGDLDPYYPGLEIVIATRDDGAIYAWHCDGTPIVQKPYSDGRIFVAGGPLWASPAIGDINNDGKMDIVFGVRRTTNNLYAITSYDTVWLPLPNWPITVPGRVFSAPVLGDLDKNEDLEILVRTEQADIYVFKSNGTGFFPLNGLLFNGPGNAFGAPALGDINRDGSLEIVSCGGSDSESLYVWDRYGNHLPPFPIFIQSGQRLQCSAVLANIIGDSRLEIAFFAEPTGKIYLVSPDGYVLWSRNLPGLEFIESYPVFADITGDRKPEIICGESKSGILTVFDSLGNPLSGFPLISTEHDWRRLISADINNDNISDIIVPTNNWKVYGYDRWTKPIYGFPIEVGNYISSSPAVFDIDFDGKLELMIAPCDFKFYVFELNTTKYEWPRFRYDQYNSGWYKSENLIGIENLREKHTNINAINLQVYPNPFNKNLTIKFQFPHNRISTIGDIASIKIFDVSGRLIKRFDQLTNLSSHQITWDGCDESGRKIPAGVYFIRLEYNAGSKTEKVILIR